MPHNSRDTGILQALKRGVITDHQSFESLSHLSMPFKRMRKKLVYRKGKLRGRSEWCIQIPGEGWSHRRDLGPLC